LLIVSFGARCDLDKLHQDPAPREVQGEHAAGDPAADHQH
jgi:hypothetical protein